MRRGGGMVLYYGHRFVSANVLNRVHSDMAYLYAIHHGGICGFYCRVYAGQSRRGGQKYFICGKMLMAAS